MLPNFLPTKKVALATVIIASLAIVITQSFMKNQNQQSANQIPSSNQPTVKPTPKSTADESTNLVHIDIAATVFWVGEEETEESGFISNAASFWDKNWQEHFGGVDDPDNRNGFWPQDFTPRQNPFYIALPYADFDSAKNLKASAKKIPWYKSPKSGQSVVKNRWVKVSYREKICFGQWEDVGPKNTDDFDYVFGQKPPRNSFSGIDLSPAVRDCLEMRGRAKVSWQFIEDSQVPDGAWKQIITKSAINW